MLRVFIHPGVAQLPASGGVREHMLQLIRCASADPDVELGGNSFVKDSVAHLESSFTVSRPADVYVCHGGFEPPPPQQKVIQNLESAKVIVSVAKWMAIEFLKPYSERVVVIPNGVVLEEWDTIPPSNIAPGYVLYAKEYAYHIEDLVILANNMRGIMFVTTAWPGDKPKPANVVVIGLQSRDGIRPYLNSAGALLITGSEVCPTMLLEAWACSVPVVAANGRGNAELMGDGFGVTWANKHRDGGVLYDTISEAMAGIAYCLQNKEKVGVAGRKIVEQRYQWDRIYKKYKRVWAACAARTEKSLIWDAQARGGWV